MSSPIEDVAYEDLEELWSAIEPLVAAQTSLQAVAQRFTEKLYERFAPSIVLARTFATADLRLLPALDRAFVERIANGAGRAAELNDATPILSLLGTRGTGDLWNDRRDSRDHLAIPLLSAGFVGDTPMIARLLSDIGFTPVWRGASPGFVTKTLANVNGIFYVHDAASALDERGRNVIPAAGFVERHGIRTVFGFGGSYLSGNTFITTIVFCRHEIVRTDAMKFIPLMGSLKAATTRLVNRGAIFA